jgi:hypothetical protein
MMSFGSCHNDSRAHSKRGHALNGPAAKRTVEVLVGSARYRSSPAPAAPSCRRVEIGEQLVARLPLKMYA